MCGSRGGIGGPDPERALHLTGEEEEDPPWKITGPLEKVGSSLENVEPPLDPWKSIVFSVRNHWTPSVLMLRTRQKKICGAWTPTSKNSWICACCWHLPKILGGIFFYSLDISFFFNDKHISEKIPTYTIWIIKLPGYETAIDLLIIVSQ